MSIPIILQSHDRQMGLDASFALCTSDQCPVNPPEESSTDIGLYSEALLVLPGATDLAINNDFVMFLWPAEIKIYEMQKLGDV